MTPSSPRRLTLKRPAAGGCLTLTTALFHSPQDRIQHRQLGRRQGVGPRAQAVTAAAAPRRGGPGGWERTTRPRWPAADGTPTTSGACTATRLQDSSTLGKHINIPLHLVSSLSSSSLRWLDSSCATAIPSPAAYNVSFMVHLHQFSMICAYATCASAMEDASYVFDGLPLQQGPNNHARFS